MVRISIMAANGQSQLRPLICSIDCWSRRLYDRWCLDHGSPCGGDNSCWAVLGCRGSAGRRLFPRRVRPRHSDCMSSASLQANSPRSWTVGRPHKLPAGERYWKSAMLLGRVLPVSPGQLNVGLVLAYDVTLICRASNPYFCHPLRTQHTSVSFVQPLAQFAVTVKDKTGASARLIYRLPAVGSW